VPINKDHHTRLRWLPSAKKSTNRWLEKKKKKNKKKTKKKKSARLPEV
jgi:hypothetical protein